MGLTFVLVTALSTGFIIGIFTLDEIYFNDHTIPIEERLPVHPVLKNNVEINCLDTFDTNFFEEVVNNSVNTNFLEALRTTEDINIPNRKPNIHNKYRTIDVHNRNINTHNMNDNICGAHILNRKLAQSKLNIPLVSKSCPMNNLIRTGRVIKGG